MGRKRSKRRAGATRRQSAAKREGSLPASLRAKKPAKAEVNAQRKRALAVMRRPADEMPAKAAELREMFKGVAKDLDRESNLAPEDLGCKNNVALDERM